MSSAVRELRPSADNRAGARLPLLAKQLELLIGEKRGRILALAVVSVLSGLVEAGTLTAVAQITTDLVKKPGKGASARTGLLAVHLSLGTFVWIALGLALLRLLLQIPLATLPAAIAADVQQGQRRKVFRAFTRASWDIQSRDREGALQESLTNQTSQTTLGALMAANLVSGTLLFLMLMGFAILLSPVAAFIMFGCTILVFAALRPTRMLGKRRSRELSAAYIRYAGAIAEANRLAEESHVFGVMDAQYERMVGFLKRVRDLYYRSQMIAKVVPNLYQGAVLLLLVVGLAVLAHIGAHQPARLLAIVLLLVRCAQSGQSVQGSYQGLQQALPFIDRVRRTEKRYRDSPELSGSAPIGQVHELAFDGVGFAYAPGRPVLSDISFVVQSGEAIGIVGPSGAGKSTLVQILLQLRAPIEGSYLVNGEQAALFSREEWHRLVAYVPQEPRLLHASVADNIRFFRDIDEESIMRAGELARIHEDIMSWPKGYETIVGPRADAVSGGQQQRICLARALAAEPQVLVLDEPTSALDPQSEALIQESLLALKHSLTLFTVAHRMSTLDMCDRVMVIVDGRLSAFDTRAVLREQNHYYRTASLIASSAAAGGAAS